MPELIKRDIAIIKYRKLPLAAFDKVADKELVYYPKIYGFRWLQLPEFSEKVFSMEFKALLQGLNIQKIIYLGQYNKPWISSFTRGRTDYPRLLKTIAYFDSFMPKTFNGAVKTGYDELNKFLPHFLLLSRVDSGFSDFYLVDEKQSVLFYIHYTGDIKILCLNKSMDKNLEAVLLKSKFKNSWRSGNMI